MITPRPLNDPENNVFDKAFNTEMDMESWQDWMRWDGGAEIAFPIANCRGGLAGNSSSPETYSTDAETASKDDMSVIFSQSQPSTFDDAPFDLDDEVDSNTITAAIPDQSVSQAPQRVRRAFLALTEAEERELQEIAMPYRSATVVATTLTVPASPTVSQSSPSLSPSVSPEPENRTRKYRKRKASQDEELPLALCQSRKRGHNAIEKRYRTNLNEKIICLRQGIPSLCRSRSTDSAIGEDAEESEEDLDSKTGQQKYGKAAILTRALEYIKHLENTTQRLGGEADILRTRVGAFEKLAMGGSLVLSGRGIDVSNRPSMVKSETLESIQAGMTCFLNVSLRTC
jgi:hypothetical protein